MKDLLYLREKSLKEIIELIFQVYIDSYSDPHEVLKKNSFGRAHHRLLCIIEGNPNISIADISKHCRHIYHVPRYPANTAAKLIPTPTHTPWLNITCL